MESKFSEYRDTSKMRGIYLEVSKSVIHTASYVLHFRTEQFISQHIPSWMKRYDPDLKRAVTLLPPTCKQSILIYPHLLIFRLT
jgi:hypothetical protein